MKLEDSQTYVDPWMRYNTQGEEDVCVAKGCGKEAEGEGYKAMLIMLVIPNRPVDCRFLSSPVSSLVCVSFPIYKFWRNNMKFL